MKSSEQDPFPDTHRLLGLRPPFAISLLYLLFGILWITFSDNAANSLATSEEQLNYFSNIKGWLFIVVTACLLYALLLRDSKRREAARRKLQESEESLRRSQEIAHLGSWKLDLENNRLSWSAEAYRIFGIPPDQFKGTYEAFLETVHPDDRERVNAAYTDSIRDTQDAFEIEHRVVWADETIRHVYEKCIHERNTDGKIFASIGFSHDITEQVQNELPFQMLFESSPFGAAIYKPVENNRDFILSDINSVGLEYAKLSRDQIVGHKVTDVFPGVRESGLLNLFRRVAETGNSESLPVTHYKDRRIEQWVENDVFKLPSGQIVSIFNDITEQKVMEEALFKSDKLLRDAQAAAHIGCWEYDIGEDKHLWSDEMFRIFGLNVGDPLPGWEGLRTSFPNDWERLDAAVKGAIQGTPYEEDFRIIRPDGSIGWGRALGSPVKDKGGNIIRLIGTVQDITERKRQDQELEESRAVSQATLDGLSANIAVLDENGVIISVNRKWRDFAKTNGVSPGEVSEGTNYVEICEQAEGEDKEDAHAIARGMRKVLKDKRSSFSMEYPCHSKTELRWFIVQVTRFPGDGPIRMVVAHENITKRKQAEEALKQRNRELERFNKLTVGRELRMIELKKEINALCRELQRDERYPQNQREPPRDNL
jgi:PAS domain S-box-containing protein